MSLVWPVDLRPTGWECWIEEATLRAESPLSFAIQVVSRNQARWVAQMEWRVLDRARAQRLQALLARLQGGAVEALLFDFAQETPAGTAAPWPGGSATTSWGSATTWGSATSWGGITPPTAPQLRLAAARGDTLLQSWGWAPAQTVLRAGDRIGLGGRLHMVTADTVSTAISTAEIAIAPPLRAAAAAGAPLVLTRPTAPFRLVDGTQARMQVRSGGPFWSASAGFVESL